MGAADVHTALGQHHLAAEALGFVIHHPSAPQAVKLQAEEKVEHLKAAQGSTSIVQAVEYGKNASSEEIASRAFAPGVQS